MTKSRSFLAFLKSLSTAHLAASAGIFTLLFSGFLNAQTLPPTSGVDAINWQSTQKTNPADGLKMGALAIELEETTLDQVRIAVGVGAIAFYGETSESEYYLCYTDTTPKHAARIWLASNGEMGGSEHVVTRVSALHLQKGIATADCPALPNKLKPMALNNGLWLNSRLSTIKAKLGHPSYTSNTFWSFNYDGKTQGPGNCQPSGYDVLGWLVINPHHGRIKNLHIGRVTSC
jgi:hypothetical protein